ncbi:MAG: ATP-dependent zinc metalloprotease FtsH [Anaerolineales bacterium]
MRRLGPRILWLILLVAMSAWIWRQFGGVATTSIEINYSTFRTQVREGNVDSVTVQGEEIRGTLEEETSLRNRTGETVETTNFVTYLPSFGDDNLLPLLDENGVQVETEPDTDFSLLPLLINLLPFLLLGVFVYFYFRRMQSQGQGIFSMGQSRAKMYDRRTEHTTFDDVAGAEGAKTELREVIEFLKEPDKFHRLGGSIPKGVLLVGPPGTGKTLMARAVAGEAEVPFYSITGSDFMEMFVGVGASRVRDMFKEAKKVSPSIIFIDELDSIGRRRGAGLGGGHDEREQTLNQMLNELDGFEPNESVIVMAATNRPDILDPALLRPGRFDRQITVDLPTMKDREDILKIHSRNKPLTTDVDLERVARGTPGFSGADLENLLNEAALLAARKGKDAIGNLDIEEARDKVLMGLERRNLALTEKETRMIAYHEAGHAVVAAALTNTDPIHKVTIVPRGRAMGVTQQMPERERYLYPQEYMLDRLAVMMGGRAAEDMIFETKTSGAENDLKQATKLARKMVLDWGMSPRLGNVALGSEKENVFLGEEITQRREYSETTAREIDEEVKKILDDSYSLARGTLEEHREGMEKVVDALVEKEELTGKEVMRILGFSEDGSEPERSEEDVQEKQAEEEAS